MAWEIIRQIFEHGIERSSRSTVLTTLITMGAILSGALVLTGIEHAPEWMSIFFAVLLGVDFIAFIIAYGYFAKVGPDSLRSERFFIQKMAIERGLVGDKASGIFPLQQVNETPRAIEQQVKRIEGGE